MPSKLPYRYYLRGEAVRHRLYRDGVPHRILAEQLGITGPYLSQLICRRQHLSAELRYRLGGAAVLRGLSDQELWEREDIAASGDESSTSTRRRSLMPRTRAMNKREAKREACSVVARLIESYQDVGQPGEDCENGLKGWIAADEAVLAEALDLLAAELRRRSGQP